MLTLYKLPDRVMWIAEFDVVAPSALELAQTLVSLGVPDCEIKLDYGQGVHLVYRSLHKFARDVSSSPAKAAAGVHQPASAAAAPIGDGR
jgi:hypothetical protein